METLATPLMQSVKDILKVSASNVVKLLAGLLVAFVLPKIIGVADYGYYKTFTLYATYVGLFHLGICDGIYLKYGGKCYDDLEKSKFRFYSKAFFVIETAIALLLGLLALIVMRGEWLFICLSLSVYLLAINITAFYQIISQVTSRFSELSWRNVIQSSCICLAVLGLWILADIVGVRVTYRMFLVAYVSIVGLLAVWYINTYRDITFGPVKWSRSSWKELISFAKIGIPLTVANLCSTLILTLDRQFVSIFFDIDTYAVYAFAYNMLSLVTTVLTAVATVVYPKLKRLTADRLRLLYPRLMGAVLGMVLLSLSVFFPLSAFVEWYLPAYIGALPIFRIILPGLALSSCISIVMHNYYKALDENIRFFRQTLVVLILSVLANVGAYFLLGTPAAISIASVAIMAVWYWTSERFLVKTMSVRHWRNTILLVVGVVAFYVISGCTGLLTGFVLYCCLAAALVAGIWVHSLRASR
ncbi:oligosaccharide flippase family protein [Adlercreutzia rubneri]